MQPIFQKLTLSKAILVLAVIEPLMTLPQLYEIWIRHQTAGVSLLTWLLLACGASTWAAYGLKIKDKPVIISGTLWASFQLLIVLGLILN